MIRLGYNRYIRWILDNSDAWFAHQLHSFQMLIPQMSALLTASSPAAPSQHACSRKGLPLTLPRLLALPLSFLPLFSIRPVSGSWRLWRPVVGSVFKLFHQAPDGLRLPQNPESICSTNNRWCARHQPPRLPRPHVLSSSNPT